MGAGVVNQSRDLGPGGRSTRAPSRGRNEVDRGIGETRACLALKPVAGASGGCRDHVWAAEPSVLRWPLAADDVSPVAVGISANLTAAIA
jgi:hypothetical protein